LLISFELGETSSHRSAVHPTPRGKGCPCAVGTRNNMPRLMFEMSVGRVTDVKIGNIVPIREFLL